MIYLEVHQLTKTYNRRTVFADLSFTHSEGVLGISGANGSGKSTLLKCLAFLLRPKIGSITWKRNMEILLKEDVKPLISYAAPYINLYSELTAFENLEFIQEVSGVEKNSDLTHEILNFVQMEGYADQLFKQLSTGQQQRIKLGSALVRDSKILFLDEPGSNLDKKGHELVSRIVHQQKEKGNTVILASNDAKEIILCDNVVKLVNG
tara:strand:+ start:32596 stop:33216 length:621 start_codon:yes stop_codon:yes gene_type:complete